MLAKRRQTAGRRAISTRGYNADHPGKRVGTQFAETVRDRTLPLPFWTKSSRPAVFKFDQPRGFHAMHAETEGFTRIASHVRVSVELGDRVVLFNIAERHVAAVVTVTESATKRSEGED